MFWLIETVPNLNNYLTQCSPKRLKRRGAWFLHVNPLGISKENVIYQERIIILSCIYFTFLALQIERDLQLTSRPKPFDLQLPILLRE